MMPDIGILSSEPDSGKIIESDDPELTFGKIGGKVEQLESQLCILVDTGISRIPVGPVSSEIIIPSYTGCLIERVIPGINGPAKSKCKDCPVWFMETQEKTYIRTKLIVGTGRFRQAVIE